MSLGIRGFFVAVLVRLYPAAWRSEYGAELRDVLLARPLGPLTIADVLWNGLRLRAPAAEPSTILGVPLMLVIMAGLIESGGGAMLQPSSRTIPPVAVTVMTSPLLVYLLIFCGCWTHLRYGGSARRSGLAAMRMGFIVGIPVMLAAMLMLSGRLELRAVGAHAPPLPAWAILISPMARLPECWIWGALGGLLGRQIARNRKRAGAIPASSL
jgi:hypothetical protein